MPTRVRILIAVTAFCAARFAFALSPGETVDNFRLLDHTGASRELYYLSDMKAVVLVAQGTGCEASRKALPGLKALREKYQSQGVEFLLIDSNLADTRASIVKEAGEQGIDLPILIDETQLIGESLGLTSNGEVLVVNPQGWKLAYRGPLAGSAQYAEDALEAVVHGEPVKTAKVDAKGCAIEAGAPRGAGKDPLAELQRTWPEWTLGEPDLVVEIPAFDVPAAGTIPYQMPSAANPLDHDVWVRAVDFLPGDRTVLHHIIYGVVRFRYLDESTAPAATVSTTRE